MHVHPLPFDRSQQLYLLKPRIDPAAAVHPQRFHANRQQPERSREGPESPDAELWVDLPRADLLRGLFQDQRLDRVALTTDAGLGKSYNLRWLHCEIRCAFLLSIGDLVSAPDLISDKLVPLLRSAPQNAHENRDRLAANLERLRQRGQLTLLFDGLDMASDASVETLAQLLDPRSDWSHCRIVVAGRPFALERHWSRLFTGKPWQFVQIGEFSAKQQRRALGQLPGGQDRYRRIPEEARNILTVPRVLEYLRPLDEGELEKLHSVADVYWQATGYMLRHALGKNVDVRTWQRFLALLGALAFTMYGRTERHDETGELRPNLDRIPALDMPDFLEEVLGRLEAAVPRYSEDKLQQDLPELSRLNAILNHGWFDVSNVGGVGEDLLWRNASLQEFFAAYWVTRWGNETDRQHLLSWVVEPLTNANAGFYWFWRFASEMPDEAILPGSTKPPVAWQAAMSPLYDGSVVDEQKRPIRSTEFICRTWERMVGTQAQTAFLGEFQQICNDVSGSERKAIAHRLLDGFLPLVHTAKPGDTGTFTMGAPPDEDPDWDLGDNPLHAVTLSRYWLHRYCVTNVEYELFDPRRREKRWWGGEPHPAVEKSKDPSADDQCPVVMVSWYDARCFARWLGLFQRDGLNYQVTLASEAQWEYACRAGQQTPFTFQEGHDGKTCTVKVCNFDGRFPFGEGAEKGPEAKGTLPVDGLKPNRWGFYQMHGNVWEWCADWYSARFYDSAQASQLNPQNDIRGSPRLLRGGGWLYGGQYCRAADRDWDEPAYRRGNLGFRLARIPVGAKQAKQGK